MHDTNQMLLVIISSATTLTLAMINSTFSGASLAFGNGDSGNTAILSSSSHAKTRSGSKGSAVVQEPVNTGNPAFDKINKFYSCVSKVTHEPKEPSKDQVDNCYFQVFGESNANDNFGTHSTTTSGSKVVNSPLS